MNLQIGTIIKNLRMQNKTTQDQLATFLGVTPQAISRWESGAGYPDIELLPTIAAFFSVSTDELLGVNLPAREKRRAEVYAEMTRLGDYFVEHQEEALPFARQALAEFPSDIKVQVNLADVLCQTYMWEEAPDMNALKEAERIYQTVIQNAEDADFKNGVIESLAALYKQGFKNDYLTEATVAQLPKIKYSREVVKASLANLYDNNAVIHHKQELIETLVSLLENTLRNYIAYDLPNDPEHWDEKIAMLRKLIELYYFIYGDNLLFYHYRVAGIYRYIATYQVAQGKVDETLTTLETMCDHIIAHCNARHGERYTSPFTDRLIYQEVNEDWHEPTEHNYAYEIVTYKLTQDRYDPIREEPRFKAVEARLREIMY
ncbi:MAG: helix-turn-helix transcriptional regulator [Clostridia bacterium]|nr:helix-turn-helix transcriptional regulator [Clostridia bacterium]